MPTRKIYMIQIKGRYDNNPHPHIDLSDSGNERLLVPAFDATKDEVEVFITDQKNLAFRDAQIFVRMNNKKMVTWVGTYQGKEDVYWLTARIWKSPEEDLSKYHCGEMDYQGVCEIAKSLLERSKKVEFLSKKSYQIILDLYNACEAEAKNTVTLTTQQRINQAKND